MPQKATVDDEEGGRGLHDDAVYAGEADGIFDEPAEEHEEEGRRDDDDFGVGKSGVPDIGAQEDQAAHSCEASGDGRHAAHAGNTFPLILPPAGIVDRPHRHRHPLDQRNGKAADQKGDSHRNEAVNQRFTHRFYGLAGYVGFRRRFPTRGG